MEESGRIRREIYIYPKWEEKRKRFYEERRIGL